MIFFTKFGDSFCESPNLVTNIVTILVSFFETIDSGKYCEKSFTKFSDDFWESPNLVIYIVMKFVTNFVDKFSNNLAKK